MNILATINNITCPSCGAPINWNDESQEMNCPYCKSVLTKDDIKLVQAKLNSKIIDINTADIDQLHELEKTIGQAKSFQIRQRAHKLLIESLGDNYEEFISKKQITITGKNNKDYIIHINGYVECYTKDGTKTYDGQIYRNGYPASDALVTLIQYIRNDTDGLEKLWGCGNIKLQGGEIRT